MMGDFATPATANGSSICINNNNINGGIGAGGSGNNVMPKHSTVVERLRQRIEGCRRHHVNCETRYQQAHAEQLEIERRETVSLYQRSLEQRVKKSAHNKQQNKQQDPESASTTEQRNSTLIALQETVKRKLDSARSPLNGDQNGICDGNFSPSTKRLRKEAPSGGLDSLVPPVSPLHPMDINPPMAPANSTNNGSNHAPGRPDDLGKNGGLPDVKLNGSLDLDDGFTLFKDMKQEPLDDTAGIESSDTSLSNQKLFSDINLNDQEWQELIDELANTVPEDDMHDLFNEDFEEKKEVEFTRPAVQTPLPQDPPLAPPSQNSQMSMGSPQVRPSSSGPQFTTTANGTPPQQSPVVALASGSPANCTTQSPQTPTQAQTQPSRPGNGYLMNPGPVVVPGSAPRTAGTPGQGGGGPVPVPTSSSELTPAEQLKQMAAQQQQRAKLIQQKQQQQQQTQAASWSPARPPSSPYGGPFNSDKPNSPMMYPQAFNTQNSVVPAMGNNPQKAMSNYLPQNPMNVINQQPNSMGQSTMSKQQGGVLSYSNTKPLSHFNTVDHISQRMTLPVANPGKNTMMPYMQSQVGQNTGQAQGQVPGQVVHLTEEQKRMLLLKQKVLNQTLPYNSLQTHGQEQNMVGVPRQPGGVQPSLTGPGGVVPGTNGSAPGYLGNPQQAAMMKQMMQMEQEKRVQLHLLEQQKQQALREQRQQQLLAEQLQQQHPRQLPHQQRSPYPVQQVTQFQGSQQEMAARNQALQNIRNARLLQQQQQQPQNQGMLQIAPVQNSTPIPAGAGQSDMGVAYTGQPAGQQSMYGLNAGVNQILQHPAQGGVGMAHNATQVQRQPGSGHAGGMVSGYGQGMLMNPDMSQQPMKGPAIAKGQAQRLQSMMGGASQAWQQQQQQNLQATAGRTSGEMAAFNGSPVYAMQAGQPRIVKQHFPQAVGQPMVDPRAVNPAMGGQMMRTNQPRPVALPGMAQVVPNMAPFSQAQSQPMVAAGGSYMQGSQPPTYQRTPSQDLSYGYSGQPSGGGAYNLPERAELDSADGWMDEFFSSQ
ncbi:mastermind-like protein 3 [Paramormyrops kingsleyae]|uniref:mastermind-like protein 3 n=1 Tax=Paramormyrops kingsleyae TaxID=1676925 RepID=UPI003B97B82E